MDYESILQQGVQRQQNLNKAQNNQIRGDFMTKLKLNPN